MQKTTEQIEQFAQMIEKEISEIVFPKYPAELYEPISYVLSLGGKRIRPLLLMLSYSLYKNNANEAINAALAVEMFHNFTLLHDDIMDKAQYRRGNQTVHVKWNDNVAILSGDAMLSYSYKLLAKSNEKIISKLLDQYNAFSLNIFEGQQLDMQFETRNDVTIAQYIEMITLKTSVLIAGAIKMGAIIGGAKEEDIKLLDEFGVKLGLAFQIQDDLLDTFGDYEKFGKKIGGDIMSAKKTYLLITTTSLATKSDVKQLGVLLRNKTIEATKKIEYVTAIYNKYGVREIAEKAINDNFTQALEALSKLNVPQANKEPLREAAMMLINRNK